MKDVIIVALITVFLSVFLVKRIINDYKRERLDEKRFVLKHLGDPTFQREFNHYKNRDKGVIKGVVLGFIVLNIYYIYLRLSGKM